MAFLLEKLLAINEVLFEQTALNKILVKFLSNSRYNLTAMTISVVLS